jgi:hypothetical protein
MDLRPPIQQHDSLSTSGMGTSYDAHLCAMLDGDDTVHYNNSTLLQQQDCPLSHPDPFHHLPLASNFMSTSGYLLILILWVWV